jgi:hypothetical protein
MPGKDWFHELERPGQAALLTHLTQCMETTNREDTKNPKTLLPLRSKKAFSVSLASSRLKLTTLRNISY